ncbi:hypothetical protein H4R26_000224 [Coemansia thaxteri]|uniref:Nucleoside phosphorylase domain-containing protein n=1 Tax=Coemansia thaxteri TaxID=2663907 RepID=A0A9W8BP72_9FUNG|nr:hypothetical protein H4R26_000224 [Coemansia thaxteri]KAJ2487618.1 hypothetical protein EV174_000446 [Coemansia sp. RSA 2320]
MADVSIVANRIVTVGDPQRARILAQYLDKILFEHESHRGFLTITGLYKSLPVSIVAIGMGLSMMDFFVRETRMVVTGPLAIVRLGSCGSICSAKTGDLIIASSAFGISRNHDYFLHTPAVGELPYLLSLPVDGDAGLTAELEKQMLAHRVGSTVVRGSVGNADSFYGSQGRPGTDFYDANDGLLAAIRSHAPDVAALEMESHMLFHLARTSTGPLNDRPASIRAACALLVFADREGNSFITPENSARSVRLAAAAVLDSLVAAMPTQDGLHPAEASVWK